MAASSRSLSDKLNEIVASIGVIVSILFLADSIHDNTIATQSENDNFIYEMQFARIHEIAGNPSLAMLYTKLGNGDTLTEIEKTQLRWDNLQQLGTWKNAFVRHRDDFKTHVNEAYAER